MQIVHAIALAIGGILVGTMPANAATVAFSGKYQNSNPPASPTGRCAPAARTVSIGPADASGTSVLGNFTPTTSHCIPHMPPSAYTDGLFSFDFGAGNLLKGTYSGTLSASADPTVFNNVQNFTVTGGTGSFLNASGSFTGTGTVTFAAGALPFAQETLSGTLNVPGIPEPGAWAMMIGGFALAGGACRTRRGREAPIACA